MLSPLHQTAQQNVRSTNPEHPTSSQYGPSVSSSKRYSSPATRPSPTHGCCATWTMTTTSTDPTAGAADSTSISSAHQRRCTSSGRSCFTSRILFSSLVSSMTKNAVLFGCSASLRRRSVCSRQNGLPVSLPSHHLSDVLSSSTRVLTVMRMPVGDMRDRYRRSQITNAPLSLPAVAELWFTPSYDRCR